MEDSLISHYEVLFHQNKGLRKERRFQIQKSILSSGIPITKKDGAGFTMRGKIWKLLLGIKIDISKYKSLVELGPFIKSIHGAHLTPGAEFNVEDDVNRTGCISKYDDFNHEEMVKTTLRVAHAYLHLISQNDSLPEYSQGTLNVILLFLHEMPEIDAFFCFLHYFSHCAPTYLNCFGQNEANTGIDRANRLVHDILEKLDPLAYTFGSMNGLFNHLAPNLYFCFGADNSCFRKDISSLYRLWDVVFAFGPYMWPIYNVALFVLVKKYDPDGKFLKKNSFEWPLLDADEMITLSLSIIRSLKESYPDLLSRVFYHSCYLGL